MNAKEQLQQYLHQNPTIITIAGNIGLGKTTTAEAFASDLEISISRELDNNVLDQELLWKFVGAAAEEKPEHCYILQEDLCYRRLEARRGRWIARESFIEDRTPEEDPAVLHRLFLKNGYLGQKQYDDLQHLWKAQARKTPTSEIMVVLQGSAELARAGIEHRGRPGESEGWQLERDLKPMEQFYREFPGQVEQYGLHNGVLVEVDRAVVDPLRESHREEIYRLIMQELRKKENE